MRNIRGSEWHKWDLHLHTASSYDSSYKGADADELLCNALRKNEIEAVAITDHFMIDNDRINNLRKLAPEIVFFPGVELRTDKGANNLHLILIFPETIDVNILSQDFQSFMFRIKAKAKDSNDTIFWEFGDILEFCKQNGGLLSIHAGKKSNGIDKEISNALPFKEAVKEDIAENVDFFEVGRLKDIEDYHQYVFKSIDEKPIIICSDNHDPRKYTLKENLWIKANLTFDGLKQCLYQPNERVYIGTIPPALDRVNKNKKVNIDTISTHRKSEPKNTDVCWFDFDLPLNSGLVAIIGNKGSGKSALSDIIGQACKCKTMNNASFLNSTRFRKMPKNYSEDYISTIKWKDGHIEEVGLDLCDRDTVIEDAQYLPQKYIEEVCNDIGNVFQEEIDKVIFSYVDRTERGTATNLEELVINKSEAINDQISCVRTEIGDINNQIIALEKKKTSQYNTFIQDSLKKFQENLERHEKNKPEVIQKPVPKTENAQYLEKIEKINANIFEVDEKINLAKEQITKINIAVDETQQIIYKLQSLSSQFDTVYDDLIEYLEKNPLVKIDGNIELKLPIDTIQQFEEYLNNEKRQKQLELNGDFENRGLVEDLEILQRQKQDLISNTDIEEKRYQKYLEDIKEWEEEKEKIIGEPDVEECLLFYKKEKNYLEKELDIEYDELRCKRDEKLKELFNLKKQIASIYEQIYVPVKGEVEKLLGELEDSIEFEAEIQLIRSEFPDKVLSFISQRFAGAFKGRVEATNRLEMLTKSTDFSQEESIIKLINGIMVAVDEDIDSSEKKISDKKEFYDYLYGLTYIGVSFKLKMGRRNLEELSPGERGIVLLIFYLALSQSNMPIIIDQPEDNLDNQSVYNKLVPCICAAKKKRQVIIVTHNPNIAVACDAEQIVYCKMDKNTHHITYVSGAIEDRKIKDKVVDILEGTMPAFDLRRRKYI